MAKAYQFLAGFDDETRAIERRACLAKTSCEARRVLIKRLEIHFNGRTNPTLDVLLTGSFSLKFHLQLLWLS